MATLKNTTISDNGYLGLPSGSFDERPESPEIGYIRYNTEFNTLEIYDGSNWKTISSTT